MDGVHDLGGKQGYGVIEREAAKSVFHDDWEGRVFAMVLMGYRFGAFHNTDHFRHTVERIDPVGYLSHGYYGRWVGGLETALIEGGLLSADAVNERAGASATAARPSDRAERFPEAPPRQPTAARASQDQAKFAVGQRLRAAVHGWSGHTRLPAYIRGRTGEVRECHGAWVFPDSNAHGGGEQPQFLYTVAFSGVELWGEGCEPGNEVCIDLFESYLEAQ